MDGKTPRFGLRETAGHEGDLEPLDIAFEEHASIRANLARKAANFGAQYSAEAQFFVAHQGVPETAHVAVYVSSS